MICKNKNNHKTIHKKHKKNINKTHKNKQQRKLMKGGVKPGQCFDYIMQEELDIEKYISENPDNIVFQFSKNNFICSSKEFIFSRYDDAIDFICVKPVSYSNFRNNIGPQGEKIYYPVPFFNLQPLALAFGGIATVENLFKVVLLTKDQFFILQKVGEAESTISYKSASGDNIVSDAHCQVGSNRTIYKIFSESQPTYNDSECSSFRAPSSL